MKGLRQSLVLTAAKAAFAPSLAKRIVVRAASALLRLRRKSALKAINAPRGLTARKVAALNPKAAYAKENHHAVASVLGATA
jgi:hypothetical protein